MRVVFLVPRREDGGHRDRLWAWCRARWERHFPDIPIYEGHHEEGLFNRAAAVNTAAAAADEDGRWDVAIVIDSDVFLKVSQVREAIERAVDTGRVTWAHRRWRELHEEWTARTLHDDRDFGAELDATDLDVLVQRTNPISWSCCIVIPRTVWDDLGGFDERFEGWGFEDMAFQAIVVGLYGHERIEGDVLNLWHPRSGERIVKGKPRSTASVAYVQNARLGRRYMLAARRDHKVHDREDPGDEVERQRDMANLRRDDALWSAEARRFGLPDWDDWWPTLEELRDGAKAHRLGPLPEPPTITVVVHTGGTAATWPDRSTYLRRSLASLNDQVRGPVVQRVVYSDWGERFRAELEAIAAEHGFYVAGEGHHGYTGSMRALWRYLSRRAKGSLVFLAEDDFTYDGPIDLAAMAEVLEANRHLTQMALLRDACYPSEREKGGILGWPTDSFTQAGANGTRWLEHRNFWTANPSLFRRSLTDRPWPNGDSSERIFADELFRRREVRAAFWGSGESMITHIGEVRAGAGY